MLGVRESDRELLRSTWYRRCLDPIPRSRVPPSSWNTRRNTEGGGGTRMPRQKLSPRIYFVPRGTVQFVRGQSIGLKPPPGKDSGAALELRRVWVRRLRLAQACQVSSAFSSLIEPQPAGHQRMRNGCLGKTSRRELSRDVSVGPPALLVVE